MISIRHFRLVLFAEFILTLFAPYILFFRVGSLPVELRKFANEQFTVNDGAQYIAAMVGLAIYVAAIAAIIGLWILRRWGIRAYVARYLITFFYCLISPPTVGEAFSTALGLIAYILAGMIFGIVFFSPFKEHFNAPRPDPDAAP